MSRRHHVVVAALVAIAALSAVPSLCAAQSGAVAVPIPVSPGDTVGISRVADRCPTFSWSAGQGAESFELAVYLAPAPGALSESSEDGSEMPQPVLREVLPGDARGYTPPLSKCFERGGSYAWLLRAETAGGTSDWSQTSLFEVARAPSMDEVEAALEVLRTYRNERLRGERPERSKRGTGAPRRGPPSGGQGAHSGSASGSPVASRDRTQAKVPRPERGAGRGAGRSAKSDKVAAAAAAPSPSGPASISLSENLRLSAASNVVKDGALFLWDDNLDANTGVGRFALQNSTLGTENTGVGENALWQNQGSSNTGVGLGSLSFNYSGSFNTAIGARALYGNPGDHSLSVFNTAAGFEALRYNVGGGRNTALGAVALKKNVSGNKNTAVGVDALRENGGGSENTALGFEALLSNTAGDSSVAIGRGALRSSTQGNNVAIGRFALRYLVTGYANVAVGDGAGYGLTSGNGNILLNTTGVSAESNTLRIGDPASSGSTSRLERSFIAGIRGVTTGVADAVPVMIDSAGQLGTVSSSRRLKEDIHGMGNVSRRLLDLRPVTFRYKRPFTDGSKPEQFGLIAEEVAEVMPELVVYDDAGRPETVRYQWLSVLLLNEVERQDRVIGELQARLRLLETGRR